MIHPKAQICHAVVYRAPDADQLSNDAWIGNCLDLDILSQAGDLVAGILLIAEAILIAVRDDLAAGRDPSQRSGTPEDDEDWAVIARHQEAAKSSQMLYVHMPLDLTEDRGEILFDLENSFGAEQIRQWQVEQRPGEVEAVVEMKIQAYQARIHCASLSIQLHIRHTTQP